MDWVGRRPLEDTKQLPVEDPDLRAYRRPILAPPIYYFVAETKSFCGNIQKYLQAHWLTAVGQLSSFKFYSTFRSFFLHRSFIQKGITYSKTLHSSPIIFILVVPTVLLFKRIFKCSACRSSRLINQRIKIIKQIRRT